MNKASAHPPKKWYETLSLSIKYTWGWIICVIINYDTRRHGRIHTRTTESTAKPIEKSLRYQNDEF